MRKRLKKKRKSCALCKPHKMGRANRWKRKDLELMERAEEDIRDYSDWRRDFDFM